jgi:hypothetical protein
MVPAMNGDPLPGHGGCAEPQPEAKEVPQRRVQREGAVGLIAMQVQADTQEHHLHHHKGE